MLHLLFYENVFFATAPGQVGNLQLNFDATGAPFDSASRIYILDISILWDIPINPNGIITSYEVTVAQTDNSSAIIYTNDSLTVTSVTQSVTVLPFTNYTVTVRASISGGEREETITIFESPEAGRQNSRSVV